MKKILIIVCTILLLFPTNKIYAKDDERYGEWTPIRYGYPLEQVKHQCGYRLPIAWTPYTPDEVPLELRYKKIHNRIKHFIAEEDSVWDTKDAQVLYSWPDEEFEYPRVCVLYWYFDIEAYSSTDPTIHYVPKLELVGTDMDGNEVVIDSTVGGFVTNEREYMEGQVYYSLKKCELKLVEPIPDYGIYQKIDSIKSFDSYILTSERYFSYVAEWGEAKGWKNSDEQIYIYSGPLDTSYLLPVERDVYRYPLYYFLSYKLNGGSYTGSLKDRYYPARDEPLPELFKENYIFVGYHYNEDFSDPPFKIITQDSMHGDLTLYAEYKSAGPTIYIDEQYIYEDSSIEDIIDLASAYDPIYGDISEDIYISEIVYEDTNEVATNPEDIDLSESNSIVITYAVENCDGTEAYKTIRLYILKDGEFVDLKIYDRYIDKDFINTLEYSSIWKNGDYREELNDAFRWLEGK